MRQAGRPGSRAGATRRLVVLPVLLALVTAVSAVTALSGAGPARAATAPLRVLSFNIHHGEGQDGRVDLDRVVAELRALDVDVIGLQEVDRHYGPRSGHADQAAELASRLDLPIVFAPHLDLGPPTGGGPRRQYGTAVLTRHPVLSATTIPLPTAPGEETRGLQEVVLAPPGGLVRVLLTHLSPGPTPSRLRQARLVAARVARSPEPVLLLGDLNAGPGSPELELLTTLLVDPGGDPTFPADAPDRRIDHVLGQGRFVGSEVLPTGASDHRGVLATVVPGDG